MQWKVPSIPFKVERDEYGAFCEIGLSRYGQGVFSAKIDPDAFQDLSQFNWHAVTPGQNHSPEIYARRCVTSTLGPDGKRKRTFEFMQNRVLGVPPGSIVDHKNGNSLDNRMDNLREADASQNRQNSEKRNPCASSKYKGVWLCSYRWRAAIRVEGRSISLGTFKKRIVNGVDEGEIDAAAAYDQAASKYFGCFARLNFPEERNVVRLGGTKYRMAYLPSAPEKSVMEKKIQNLREMKVLEIFQILADKTVPEIEELCHYLSCGVDQLAERIKMHDPDNPESVISLELLQRAEEALQKDTHVQ